MSLEHSIAALAAAIERHTDVMVLLASGSTNIAPTPVASPAEIVMPTAADLEKDTGKHQETQADAPAPKTAAKKSKPAAEKVAEDAVKAAAEVEDDGPITAKDLKAYALQRTRENVKFRDAFMVLLGEYGAKTVAQLDADKVGEVFEKAQKL